jgi:crotonobetaine/carnitine-CoA ligase
LANAVIAPGTLQNLWERAVRTVGDDPFLTFEAGDIEARWTYGEFDRLVAPVAAKLAEYGVGPERPVHLVLTNSPAFVGCWLAASRLGAAIVPSDPRATERELAEHVRRTGPAVGVCGSPQADAYPDGAPVILVDPADPELTPLRGKGEAPAVAPEPGRTAGILFTSGTTAAPKGVVVTQANYAFAGQVMSAAAAVHRGDRLLVVLPLFHANAQYYSFTAAIAAGAEAILVGAFSATRFWAQAARHRATHASLFAAPMRMILARGGEPAEPLTLRHVWYAQNLTGDEYERFATLAGVRPRQLYGMTETIAAVLTSPALEPRSDIMGAETLGCSVELGLGGERDEGELRVRGRVGVEIFGGYLDDPETTAASFEDGAFRTGDFAIPLADGQYRYAGRRGDVLKVAGENVSTVEVETVVSEHPGILDVAVVGEPDPTRDEVPIAHVVAQPGGEPPSAEELDAWCTERLAPSKRPRRFEFHEELPRTSVGKIRKFKLRQS